VELSHTITFTGNNIFHIRLIENLHSQNLRISAPLKNIALAISKALHSTDGCGKFYKNSLGSFLSNIKMNVKILSNDSCENFPKMHCLGSFLSNVEIE